MEVPLSCKHASTNPSFRLRPGRTSPVRPVEHVPASLLSQVPGEQAVQVPYIQILGAPGRSLIGAIRVQTLLFGDKGGNSRLHVRYKASSSRALKSSSGYRVSNNTLAVFRGGLFPAGSMLRSRDVRQTSASALLVVFLAGGLAAPVAHRAQHGSVAAARYQDAPDACDHRHGNGFEEPVSDMLDDDCLLCIRPLALEDSQSQPDAYVDFSPHSTHARLTTVSPTFSRISIRGPPHCA